MDGSFSEKIRTGNIHPPAADLVGFRMLSCGNGESRFAMEAGKRHHNPMGTVHGGILCTLADSAMGMAFASTLNDGETFTTLEVKINFLRPVFEETLFAEAKVVHRGRSIGLVDCIVATENGKLVARAVSTCSVLRGETARGR
jgi:uncharacterized protein (TIGR00369 family)